MSNITVEIKRIGKKEFTINSAGENYLTTIPDTLLSLGDKSNLTKSEIEYFGGLVFRTFFHNESVRNSVLPNNPNEKIVINIASDDNFIQSLPWETLYTEKHGFLLKQQNIFLYRSTLKPFKANFRIAKPLKIAFLISAPPRIMEQAPINIMEEFQSISDILLPYKNSVKLVPEERISETTINKLFLEQGPFQFLHFSGHSNSKSLLIESARSERKEEELSTSDLAHILLNKGIILAFFNSCETALTQRSASSIAFAMQKDAQIPIVLGYARSVSDASAKAFAKDFYEKLFENESIIEAVKHARISMKKQEEWWLPVLYLPRENPDIAISEKIEKKNIEPARELIAINPEQYVFRHNLITELSDAIRGKEKFIVNITGILGTGKSMLVSFLARYYEFLFDGILTADFAEKNYEIEHTFSPLIKNRYSKEALIEKLANKNYFIILDNFEHILDKNGIIKDTKWKELLEDILSLARFNSKIIITSQGNMYLSRDKRPGRESSRVKTYKIEGFTKNEVIDFIRKNYSTQDIKSILYQTDFFLERIYTYTANNPLVLRLSFDFVTNYKFYGIFADETQLYDSIFPQLSQQSTKDSGFLTIENTLGKSGIDSVLRLSLINLFTIQDALKIAGVLFNTLTNWHIIEPVFSKKDRKETLYRANPVLASFLKRKYKERFKKITEETYELLKNDKIRLSPFATNTAKTEIALLLGKENLEKAFKENLKALKEFIPVHNNFVSTANYLYLTFLSAESIVKTKEMANLLSEFANIFSRSHTIESLKCYEKALEIDREIGDKRGGGNDLTNIGNVYARRGEYDKALEYYEKALDIDREIGDKRGEGNALTNIGNVYDDLGEYDKALEYYEKALEIHREIGDKRGEGSDLGNIGVVYDDLGEYDKALENYEKALEIFHSIKDAPDFAKTIKNLLILKEKMGEEAFEKSAWQKNPASFMLFKNRSNNKNGKKE